MIDKAKKRLYIASPWISINEITDRLKQARERDVTVLVLARQTSEDKASPLDELMLSLVDVVAENNLHAKMIITDKSELFLGSPNLSGRSFSGNLEVGIRTNDLKIVKEAVKYFRDKFFQAKKRTTTYPT